MRLLIVTTVNDMMRDFLLPFARHYRALGCTVDGMARRDDTFEACATAFDRLWPIGWSRNPWDLWNLLDNVRTVRSVVARENYDLVHVHTPIAAFITRMALRKLRALGKLRVIYTAHGFHFHTGGPALPNALFLAMEKLAGRWTDYLIILTQDDMVAARRHRIVAADRVRYMPGIGVSTDQYSPQNVADETITQVRLQLGLRPSDHLFLMIAEFTANKRHGDAIRALAMLQRSDVHLALAGRGEQAKTARNLANDVGVARQVHFLGYRKDIPALIRASVATVLVSAREGLPRSVMESLCLETPVIGTNIRGINDLVTVECGWLVGVGDVAAIARAMREAMEKPEDTLARGLWGRSKMSAYDLRNIIGLHDDLYAEALGRINIAAGDPPMTSGNGRLTRVQRPSSSLAIVGVPTMTERRPARRDATQARTAAEAAVPPMRVAYLMTGMRCGGAEMQVLALAREMRHRGHEVVVLALRDEPTALAPKFAQAGIPCHSFGLNRHRNLISALVRARRWVGDWQPDILHSHMFHANIFARLLRLLAARVPVVVGTAHSINEGGFVRTLAYRLTDPLTDITTNVSPDAVAAFIRKGACPASRIIHVANGLDLQHFRPDPQARARLRGELDLNGSYVFLAVGRLSPVKDYPTLIEGFCELRKTRQNACLLIAGDGPCRANIETLIVARSLGASVRLLGLRSDIPDLMNAADCFVMSSIFEGAPMALIEAMSCGNEIVTTEFGSASSLLGNAGLVVPIGKPDLLAAAMLKVANCRRDVNVEARDRAQALFSISTIVSTWESIYLTFLRRHNHAST